MNRSQHRNASPLRPMAGLVSALVLSALLVSLPSGPAAAGGNRWTFHGPFGGRVGVVAIDPVDPDIVVAAAQPGPVYASADGGRTWRRGGAGLGEYPPITQILFDPFTPGLVYTHTSGIYRSQDGGLTWEEASDRPLENLAADPSSPGTLFATNQIQVFRSVDDGSSWAPLAGQGLPHTECTTTCRKGYATSLAVDPADPQTLYAGWGGRGTSGLYRSVDGGTNWVKLDIDLDVRRREHPITVAIHPDHPRVIYAGTTRGVVKSTDGGATWAHLADLPAEAVTELHISSSDPSVLWAISDRVGYRSVDRGRSWSPMTGGLQAVWSISIDPTDPARVLAATDHCIFGSTDGGQTWDPMRAGFSSAYASSVTISSHHPDIAYVSDEQGLFKSINGGRTWRERSSSIASFARLLAHPTHPDTVYADAFWQGLFRSTDGGRTWDLNLARHIADVAFDPSDPDTLYASAYGSNGTYMFRSTDGGSSWHRSDAGLRGGGGQIVAVATVPTTIYTVTGKGLFRSVDAGSTWASVGPVFDIACLAVDPTSGQTLYASTRDQSVRKSVDGGKTWKAVTVGLGAHLDVPLIAIDPAHPDILYAGTEDRGIYRTTDGAARWSPFNDGLWDQSLHDIVVSPTGSTVYAATESGVFEYASS